MATYGKTKGVTPMSQIKSLFIKAMEGIDLSPAARKHYPKEIALLSRHHNGRSPVELTPREIRYYLDEKRLKVPQGLLLQIVNALCFFYTHVLDWAWNPSQMLSLPTRKALASVETPLRRRFIRDMELRNLTPGTRLNYLSQVERFARYHWKCPSLLGQKEIRDYLIHKLEVERQSISAVRTAMTALRFLYTWSLGRPQDFQGIPLPKGRNRLPVVLAQEEVAQFLEAVSCPKYRAIFSVLYGAGLRVSELTGLQVGNIDCKRKMIRVNQGKGRKDRYVHLSPALEKAIAEYRKIYEPKAVLFPGSAPTVPLRDRTVSKACARYAKRAGLTKHVTAHVFRHSFATHLLENGTKIRDIQLQLGHRSVRTTEIYLKVARTSICSTTSPLDLLPKIPSLTE
jgi:site-specific recombinase XerD